MKMCQCTLVYNDPQVDEPVSVPCLHEVVAWVLLSEDTCFRLCAFHLEMAKGRDPGPYMEDLQDLHHIYPLIEREEVVRA